MTPTDLKLYELFGDKTLSFGCRVFNEYKRVVKKVHGNEYLLNDGARYDLREGEKCIIGHEPTIADLHRRLKNTKLEDWIQWLDQIKIGCEYVEYDSSKSLLSQSEETKLAIISLITSHS